MQEGDILCIKKGEKLLPTKWPLARIVEVDQGKDGYIRVGTVRTSKETYKGPITKTVLLIWITQDSQDNNNDHVWKPVDFGRWNVGATSMHMRYVQALKKEC